MLLQLAEMFESGEEITPENKKALYCVIKTFSLVVAGFINNKSDGQPCSIIYKTFVMKNWADKKTKFKKEAVEAMGIIVHVMGVRLLHNYRQNM